MEFTNPFANTREEKLVVIAGAGVDVIMPETSENHHHKLLPRKSSLGTNFSYPRLSRHESSESRSSVTSNGSVPGMVTDASDSDLSFDDDCNYNTSASELWDSFWPDSGNLSISPQDHPYPAVLRASRSQGYFALSPSSSSSPPGHHVDARDDDTIRIAQSDLDAKLLDGPTARPPPPPSASPPPPPPRPLVKKAPATYSVYPKPSTLRVPLPPRTSSLEPSLCTTTTTTTAAAAARPRQQQQQQPFLRPSKSSGSLLRASSKSSASPGHPPPRPPPPPPAAISLSVPVSPAYPPPPPQQHLRPSASAFNLRDQRRRPPITTQQQPVAHNPTPPLRQPATANNAVVTLQPAPTPRRPEAERFVSVFEFDSDDDEAEGSGSGSTGGFKRRFARGLVHKKSASGGEKLGHKKTASGDKRRGSGAAASASATATEDGKEGEGEKEEKEKKEERDQGSLSRKRGGSLGRIFGLMSR
ncbi:hypothetical protein F4780DRAFT_360164 [Xylariomycetidae sp. FL0641]|nr:hypothetical protein F4780DRAFT_360164 [Xylariomycetidae sp. FL0641]